MASWHQLAQRWNQFFVVLSQRWERINPCTSMGPVNKSDQKSLRTSNVLLWMEVSILNYSCEFLVFTCIVQALLNTGNGSSSINTECVYKVVSWLLSRNEKHTKIPVVVGYCLHLRVFCCLVLMDHHWVHAAYCSDTLGWVSYSRECICRRWNVKRSVDISTSNLGKCTEECSWTLHLERVVDFLRYTTSCLLSWSVATDVFQQPMVHYTFRWTW